ncbi:hypothetical protein F53441_8517 [Fusarium austroafricanum]|uniref:Uncharacterized protein n=1 Tax=Fusarium austroafricanum TaxID=2364996 RepID=A0A8H4KB90_9HYPO|nr:hypothetical protein F53441_8517 [Fusarium austroafricanum]
MPESLRSILVSGTLYAVAVTGIASLLSKEDSKASEQDNKTPEEISKAPQQDNPPAQTRFYFKSELSESEQKNPPRAKPFSLTEQDRLQGESMLKG